MLAGIAARLLLIFTAVSLIYYGLTPGAGLGLLAKLLAIDVGGAILVTLAYPYIRGVKKGDKISVVEDRAPAGPAWTIFIGLSNGTALDDGRLGDAIKVELLDRSIAICRISKYEGFFSNHEAKILQREIPIEIRK
ncbi:MAG: hypothetical protein QW112_02225 [Candidatus Micrarchaeia archaeon]